MANTIKLKRSAVAGRVPTTGDLDLGEIGINTYDGKVFIKKSVSGTESIVEIGTGGGGGEPSVVDGGSAATVFSGAFSSLNGGNA